MTKTFIIRVRLQDATDNQYEQFSINMTNSGYLVTIKDKNGQKYYLPLGNFKIETTNDKYIILEHVEKIILNSWNKKFQILVTEMTDKGAAWAGLVEC